MNMRELGKLIEKEQGHLSWGERWTLEMSHMQRDPSEPDPLLPYRKPHHKENEGGGEYCPPDRPFTIEPSKF